MPSKDSSTWIADKRIQVNGAVSNSINPSKQRIPLAFVGYNPSRRITLKGPIIPRFVRNVVAGVVNNAGAADLDGIGLAARFINVARMLYHDGYVYTISRSYSVIRRYNIVTGEVSTFAGQYNVNGDTNGTTLLNSTLDRPISGTIDPVNNIMYISTNPNIRAINLNTNTISTLLTKPANIDQFCSIVYKDGFIYGADGVGSTIYKIEITSTTPTPTAGTVSIIAGTRGEAYGLVNGTGSAARFNMSSFVVNQLAIDDNGNLYLHESSNRVIRKIVISTGEVSTFIARSGINYAIIIVNNNLYYTSVQGFMNKTDLSTTGNKEIFRLDSYFDIIAIANEEEFYMFNTTTRQLIQYKYM